MYCLFNTRYCLVENNLRGRILERNPDKSLKSFSPCHSQSPVQICLEIFISSNSVATSDNAVSTVELLYTVKEEGGKPDRKPYPLPYGLRNPYRNLKSELFKTVPRNLNEIVRSWIRLLITPLHHAGLVSSNNRVERQSNVVVNSWILVYLRSNLKSLTGG